MSEGTWSRSDEWVAVSAFSMWDMAGNSEVESGEKVEEMVVGWEQATQFVCRPCS